MRALKSLIKSLLMLKPSLWLKLRGDLRRVTDRNEAEVALLRFLVPPHRCAVDVGANNGIYTHELLSITDRVVAVEPNPVYVDELRRLFGSRIRLIATALSDAEGTAELALPVIRGGRASLGTIEKQNPLNTADVQRVVVPMKKLDDLLLDDVGFIKIDVEGHEESVVAGGEALIRRCRPTLLIEAEDRHRPHAVKGLATRLDRLGYAGFFLDNGALKSITTFDPAIHQPESAAAELWKGNTVSVPYYNNFIFIPVREPDAAVKP